MYDWAPAQSHVSQPPSSRRSAQSRELLGSPADQLVYDELDPLVHTKAPPSRWSPIHALPPMPTPAWISWRSSSFSTAPSTVTRCPSLIEAHMASAADHCRMSVTRR